MNIDMSQVNWLAVLVAGVAAFMLGGAWYSALFGKLWMRLQGWSDEKVAEMKKTMSPGKFLGGMMACCLVLAVAVEFLVVALNLTTATAGACLGSILWLGPAGANAMMVHIASHRRMGLYLIDAGYQFVCLVTQGMILAAWH